VQRNVRWTALLFVLALVVAACGGDGGADTTAAGGEGAVTTAAGGEGAATTAAGGEGAATTAAGGEGAATTAAGGEGAATTAAGGAAAPDLTGVELQLMGASSGTAEDEALNGLLQQFNEATGATVTFNPQPEYDSALQAALVSGDPPDVFYVDSARLPDLATSGALQPVPEGVLTDPDDIYPSLRETFTWEGTWYCPPKDFSTLGLQYDPAALEEAGVEVPTTWDELRAAAEALTTEDRAGLTMGAEWPRWGVFLFQNGVSMTNEDFTQMTLETPEAREALDFVASLYDDGLAVTAPTVDAGWPGEAFGQGKAAMTIEGNWIVNFLRDTFPDREVAYAELPAGPSGEKGTFAFTVCYAVAANAPNPEASWALVEYLTNPEGALAWTSAFPVMPARESVREDWLAQFPDLEPLLTGAEYARAFQFPPGFGDVLGVFNNDAAAIADADGTVDGLVEETTSAGQGVLSG
jgi:multiple sugar transport system substrate-binding protein